MTASLDELVGEAEAYLMVTPRANILGTLECLVGEDLKDVSRKLDVLEGLLGSDSQVIDLERDPVVAARPAGGSSAQDSR